jgi:hypothetical protein
MQIELSEQFPLFSPARRRPAGSERRMRRPSRKAKDMKYVNEFKSKEIPFMVSGAAFLKKS